jgi:hypothetical protein
MVSQALRAGIFSRYVLELRLGALWGHGGRTKGQAMERWFIVCFVIAIFLGLAVVGWHFQQINQATTAACASPDAHCGEQRF